MNVRVMGVRLQYAPANVRALVVNSLREKAAGDRAAATSNPGDRLAAALHSQADLAEQIADELEDV